MVKAFKVGVGKSIKISANSRRETTQLLGDYHYAYTITLTMIGSENVKVSTDSYRTTYHDSIYNYRKGKGVDEEMLLSAFGCIISDANCFKSTQTLDMFIYEYGYSDKAEARIAFNKCQRAFDWIYSHLTNEEIDKCWHDYCQY